MASSQAISGTLNQQDIFSPAPVGDGITRVDEYDFTTTVFGQDLTVNLFASDPNVYDTFLEVIDANTGDVLASDDNSGEGLNSQITGLVLQEAVDYRIRVTSLDSIDPLENNRYTLQTTISQGGATLTSRQVQEGDSQTGNILNFDGSLESSDYFIPTQSGENITLFDEYTLQPTVFGQELTVNLLADDPDTYDPLIEVLDANTGDVLASDDDGGEGINSMLNGLILQEGVDYRIRVTSSVSVEPNANNSYTLQVSATQGELTVTPLVVAQVPDFPEIRELTVNPLIVDNTPDIPEVEESTVNPLENTSDIPEVAESTVNSLENTPDIPEVTETPIINNESNSTLYRFRNTQTIESTYIYVAEQEKNAILADPNFSQTFELEGAAFRAKTTPGESLIPVFRYQSTRTPGTYIFATSDDFQQDPLIEQSDFFQEGNGNAAFYAYTASSGLGTDFYRFENTALPGTYLYQGPGERANTLANFPGFEDQGTVWAVET